MGDSFVSWSKDEGCKEDRQEKRFDRETDMEVVTMLRRYKKTTNFTLSQTLNFKDHECFCINFQGLFHSLHAGSVGKLCFSLPFYWIVKKKFKNYIGIAALTITEYILFLWRHLYMNFCKTGQVQSVNDTALRIVLDTGNDPFF